MAINTTQISKALIIIGLVLLGVILAGYINVRYEKCESEHAFDLESKNCYYFGTKCQQDHTVGLVQDKNACLYSPSGFMNKESVRTIGTILGGIWSVALIVYLILKLRDTTTPRKQDVVPVDKAKQMIKEWWATNYDVMSIDGKPSDGSFRFDDVCEVSQIGDDWFCLIQMEVTDGSYQGVFTFMPCLSRGEDWIRNGMSNWRETAESMYQRRRGFPLATSLDARTRAMLQLQELNPERAANLSEKMLLSDLEKPSVATMPTQQPVRVVRSPPRRGFVPFRRKRSIRVPAPQ